MDAASSPVPDDRPVIERRVLGGVAVPYRPPVGVAVVDAPSPLLCDPDRPHARQYASDPDNVVARRLTGEQQQAEDVVNAVPRRARRGKAPGECRSCHRPIWRREYLEREGGPLGEKCGGRIGHPRQPGAPKVRRPVEGGDDQLELFVVVKVKVRA